MPVEFEKATELIEFAAPRELQYEWDNSGVQLRCTDEVSSILITLDVTDDVICEAIDTGCDMILSHHPLIFRPIRCIDWRTREGLLITRLAQAGISVYSAHTSYDRADGGINDILAAQLHLRDVAVIEGDGEGLMRVGALPEEMDEVRFTEHVKQSLGIKNLVISDTECGNIGNVAVAGGSGGSYLKAAQCAGAQALVTGEAKYAQHLEAAVRGVLLVEAGHHETEICFVDGIFRSLQLRLDEVQLDLGLKKATCNSAPQKHV